MPMTPGNDASPAAVGVLPVPPPPGAGRFHYLTGLEGGQPRFMELIDSARRLKREIATTARKQPLAGRTVLAVFANPSLRTRTSLEAGIQRLGGHMITLTPGAGSWAIEWRPGVVMDGDAAEHVIEAAGVLSSYGHAIGLRAFGAQQDHAEDMLDRPVTSMATHATVPVINLESACYHPCQGLADAMTLDELFRGAARGQRFTLAWAWHPKTLGMAVPHSAMLSAARLGMHVTVAHPEGYDLHAPVVDEARKLAFAARGSLAVTQDLRAACRGAQVIYAKAWGAAGDYGDPAAGAARNAAHRDWTVSGEHMALGRDARFMHCLPVRRNVVVTDDVLDSPASVVQQQAANRMWTQMALLLRLLGKDQEPRQT